MLKYIQGGIIQSPCRQDLIQTMSSPFNTYSVGLTCSSSVFTRTILSCWYVNLRLLQQFWPIKTALQISLITSNLIFTRQNKKISTTECPHAEKGLCCVEMWFIVIWTTTFPTCPTYPCIRWTLKRSTGTFWLEIQTSNSDNRYLQLSLNRSQW